MTDLENLRNNCQKVSSIVLKAETRTSSRMATFLSASDLHHVFLQGYYMPSIFDLYTKHKGQIKDIAVVRLHGPDRKGIEKKTGKSWSRIVAPKDKDIESLVDMLTELNSLGVGSFVYVNNHFEGSAPKTIQKVLDRLPF